MNGRLGGVRELVMEIVWIREGERVWIRGEADHDVHTSDILYHDFS